MTKTERNRLARRTIPGFLSRTYSKMGCRVRGTDGKRSRRQGYWEGLPICTREEFVEWASQSWEFKLLFVKWARGGYQLRDCPTIDRKYPHKGYVIGNMQWLTQSENSRKARRTIDGKCH